MDLRKEEAILEYRLDLATEKGKKIGKEEGEIEVAKAMLANNVDVNTIVKFTGLSRVRSKNCRIKCEWLQSNFKVHLQLDSLNGYI